MKLGSYVILNVFAAIGAGWMSAQTTNTGVALVTGCLAFIFLVFAAIGMGQHFVDTHSRHRHY